MKDIDLNFIKFNNLFQDDTYNFIYNESKKYTDLVDSRFKLCNLYLQNFINYDISIKNKKLIPNDYATLEILIGWNLNDIKMSEKQELNVYFHRVMLKRQYLQYVDTVQFSKSVTGKYVPPSYFAISYTNINAYKTEFKQLVYNYLEENQILNKLISDSRNIRNILFLPENI